MHSTHVVGVDPGIVHTGLVRMVFVPDRRVVYVSHKVVEGLKANKAKKWIFKHDYGRPLIFVEGYRPRSNFNSDARMTKGIHDLQAAMPCKVLNNMGVKQVVTRELMELLHVWKFSTTTHHQDLRSAARIALLGMYKDAMLNGLIADIVANHLNGSTWTIYD